MSISINRYRGVKLSCAQQETLHVALANGSVSMLGFGSVYLWGCPQVIRAANEVRDKLTVKERRSIPADTLITKIAELLVIGDHTFNVFIYKKSTEIIVITDGEKIPAVEKFIPTIKALRITDTGDGNRHKKTYPSLEYLERKLK